MALHKAYVRQSVHLSSHMQKYRSAGKPVFRYTSVTRATPLQLSICSIQTNGEPLIPPFHWTAFPLRFEILVKMTRNAAETPRAQQKRQEHSRNVSETSLSPPCYVICEQGQNLRSDIAVNSKRNGSVVTSQ